MFLLLSRYRMLRPLVVIAVVVVIAAGSGCSRGAAGSGKVYAAGRGPVFFSLKSYFAQEALRLGKAHTRLDKTVVYEGKSENHVVSVGSWEKEIAIFADADINKSSWIDKYRVLRAGSTTRYSALDSSLKIKSIELVRTAGGGGGSGDSLVHVIKIKLSSRNFLYRMSEVLYYRPDSGYRIERMQDIKVLGRKTYDIQAAFVK